MRPDDPIFLVFTIPPTSGWVGLGLKSTWESISFFSELVLGPSVWTFFVSPEGLGLVGTGLNRVIGLVERYLLLA